MVLSCPCAVVVVLHPEAVDLPVTAPNSAERASPVRYIDVCTHIYIYIYIHTIMHMLTYHIIQTEREREREILAFDFRAWGFGNWASGELMTRELESGCRGGLIEHEGSQNHLDGLKVRSPARLHDIMHELFSTASSRSKHVTGLRGCCLCAENSESAMTA